jgi:phage shock protein A
MTGWTSRIKRITVSRIQVFLESVDEPEAAFRQLVDEMQRRIGDAVNAESKGVAAFKANQRKLDEAMGRSIRLERGAEMALRQDDEALAREALAQQVQVDRVIEDQRLALQQSETALMQARESRLHLQFQLEELKRRGREILARIRSAKDASETYKRINKVSASGATLLDEVARMQPAEELEAVSFRTSGEPSGTFENSLEYRLRNLEREAEIERRLASIRSRKQSASKLDA